MRAAGREIQQERNLRIYVVQLVEPVDGVVRLRSAPSSSRDGPHKDRSEWCCEPDCPAATGWYHRRRNRRNTQNPCRSATGQTARPGSPRRPACCGPCRTTRCGSRCPAGCGRWSGVLGDDAVVAGEPSGLFRDHAEADGMMVAAGDERRARGRAERGGVEIDITQAHLRHAVERGRGNDAAKRARRAKADVVGYDQQDVGRALGWHDARRPPGRGLRGILLDHAAEFRLGRGQLLAADGGGGVGCADDTCGLRTTVTPSRSRQLTSRSATPGCSTATHQNLPADDAKRPGPGCSLDRHATYGRRPHRARRPVKPHRPEAASPGGRSAPPGRQSPRPPGANGRAGDTS